MRKSILHIVGTLIAVVLLVACGTERKAVRPATTPTVAYPQLSHNDSLRFKLFFYEAVTQQAQGNYGAAYTLLQHCKEINPYAAETYFMLSAYTGALKGDSTMLQDLKKAAELDPFNNTYLDRLAMGYLKVKDMDQAIAAYEKLSVNSPERSDILEMLVQLYAKKRDLNNMLKTMNRIEALEGANERTTLAKMQVYSLMGKKAEELNVLKSMVNQHPNDMNYKVMMGNWLLQNGKTEEAYDAYQKALHQEPDNAMAQMSLLDYYRQVGQNQRADSIQEQMLVSEKTAPETKFTLVKQLVDSNEKSGGDSTKVINLFKRVLAQPQKDADMASLYVAYLQLKKMPKDTVLAALKQVLQISPENVEARISLIQDQWAKQEYDSVIANCHEALNYTPERMVYYYFLGMANVQLDKSDDAIAAFKKAVSVDDDTRNDALTSDCYAMLGDLYYSIRQSQQAYAAYDSCLQLKDDNFGCLNNYAYYLSMEGKQLDKAAKMSLRTVEADPDNSTFLDTYAWILFLQKRYDEAQAYIDQAVVNDSTKSGVILEHAGDIYAMKGDINTALKYWKEALTKEDGSKMILERKIKLKKYINGK